MRVKRERYGVNRDGWWILEKILLGEGEPKEFNPDSATLRGRKISHNLEISIGQSPYDLRSSERIDYVIYSYATPIAWRYAETGKWFVPSDRYSVTTSKQQGRVSTALHSVT